MSKVLTNTIRHTGGSADNITLDNSQNVTVEGNAIVDGNVGVGTTSPSGASGKVLEVHGGSGQARFALKNDTTGSAAADGFQIYSSGLDAGIQNREAGRLAFETNGAERLLIKSDGNVGIGPISPDHGLLTISQTASAAFNALVIQQGNTGSSATDGLHIGIDSNVDAYIIHKESRALEFGTANTIRMLIDSSGRVIIGDSDTDNAHANADDLVIGDTGSDQRTGITIVSDTDKDGSIHFSDGAGSGQYMGQINYNHDDNKFRIYTGGTQRLEIDNEINVASGGRFHVRGGTHNGSHDSVVFIDKENDNDWCLKMVNDHESSTDYGLYVNTSTGASYALAVKDVGSSAWKFKVAGDGDVTNANNSYGQISDQKLKENIVDANSQWNDIKAIKIRNFNFKESTGISTHTQIGVVAQEIETISAGLVREVPDHDGTNPTGTTTKHVKYSVLYMKAIKALQEAMAKIETLETKVAALETA